VVKRLAVGCQAGAVPSIDAASPDALDGATVQRFEDLKANEQILSA
jgi:hypothetical protein